MSVLPATLALGLWVVFGTGDDPKTPKVPTTEHVLLHASGKEFSGWLLDPEAETGAALLLDDGSVAIVPRDPAPKVDEVAVRPVTDVPSAALVVALAHTERGVRDRSEQILQDQGKLALPALGPALDHELADVRRRALEILSEHPHAPWCERIVARLHDADERVREMALRAYAALAPDDLKKRCERALDDDASVFVRHEAIVRLGRLGDMSAVDVLLEHLDGSTDRSLRLVTFDALRRLTGANFQRDEKAWRAYWTNHRDELLGRNMR